MARLFEILWTLKKELTIRAETAEAALQKDLEIDDDPSSEKEKSQLADKKESEELQIEDWSFFCKICFIKKSRMQKDRVFFL